MNPTLKETLTSMRTIAETLDVQGKWERMNGKDYKAKECFQAADLLRVAAYKTEYCLT